ncbi:MAG: hypothetical protein M1498_04570 [Candidatus Thermoplasmatota archaeon]|nr:hypothetical protein [Candidatus Thermoplasmatota archaeon]MCL5889379.1 hypothetical protein [Candidatus Thermoplasmatota archaeon]
MSVVTKTLPWYPSWNLDIFFLTIIGIIALALLIFGVLTAYFGKGKSRVAGGGMIAGAILLGFITYYLSDFTFHVSLVYDIILGAVFYLVAAIIGVVIGLLIFLAAIMKT